MLYLNLNRQDKAPVIHHN